MTGCPLVMKSVRSAVYDRLAKDHFIKALFVQLGSVLGVRYRVTCSCVSFSNNHICLILQQCYLHVGGKFVWYLDNSIFILDKFM